MITFSTSLFSRSTLYVAALAAFLLAGVGQASASSTLPTNLQGSYHIMSFQVIFNGQDKGAQVPTGTIKVGPTGLTGTQSPAIIFAKKLNVQSLKFTNVKSTLTSFSASFTGTTNSGHSIFKAGSTIKGTLTASGFTLKLTLKGTHNGSPLTGSATAVAKLMTM